MINVASITQVPKPVGPTVVTIGKFDGIHLGHRALLEKTKAIATEHSLVPSVLTFDRHPGTFLNPEATPLPILGPNQKVQLLDQAGIELLLTIPFDESLASLTAQEFVQRVLVSQLSSKAVVIGEDFRFGVGQQGDAETLSELGKHFGFEVHTVQALEVAGVRVSTTHIRNLLEQGDVSKAASFLGRLHSTEGIVVHGLKNGRKLGYPTANLSRDAEGMLPKDGVYAGWLYSGEDKFMAALSVGTNETVTAVPRVLEAHVLDRDDLDLYDQVVKVEYVDLIRPNLKFSGIDELVIQIGQDVESARAILTRLG
jgi:riboflavin kinase/FMN adenylyltransferase